MINRTGSMVTRYSDNRYEVTPHDQTEDQRQERELRDAVLDYALWYMAGEGAGYHPSHSPQARAAAIKELLEEGAAREEDQERREASDPQTHPVIRDELPDIYLAPGDEASPAPLAMRQWSVTIGGYPNYCEVGLIGYNEDGSPELIAVDDEALGEYDEEEEEREEDEEE